MQWIILITVALAVAFFFYKIVTDKRKKQYLERNDITEAERRKEEQASWRDQVSLLTRFIIFGVTAAFACYDNILGIILTVFFTAEAIFWIYHAGAKTRSRSRIKSLTLLMVPFGVTTFCLMEKFLGLTLIGIIVAIVLVISVRFEPVISDWLANCFDRDPDNDEIPKRRRTERR